mgnify:CR=1 FL=1
MRNFTNPLDNIHVASPCSANWDKMFGNDRKRFCGECKLNVYNLSDMTRREAENLLINSEGRLCVKFFRRSDGTVLTKDCPVGWQAVKRRVSQVTTAVFSMFAGIITGVFGVGLFQRERVMPSVVNVSVPPVRDDVRPKTEPAVGVTYRNPDHNLGGLSADEFRRFSPRKQLRK